MRGRDDRAAANQRSISPQERARLRAVAECEGRLIPQAPGHDRPFDDDEDLEDPTPWEHLRVDYLRSEWPPSKLS